MSFFIADAVAQTEGAAPPNAGFINILLLGGLFAFMYFVIIRPQRKRQKEHQSLVQSLSKGDEVVLTSGMLGKIVDVDEHYITLNAANNVDFKFQKSSVHAVLPKGTIKSIAK
ncbi:preprotein translocase subunit YajC [Teredinibacter waterburyi]|jgi:protein translocase subunit yajC|uniref:preprotein translocase subunit YajC n=1 Tax=Teredinibacter waterburyi TaxID=1500538 RepID=UPI00165F8FE2|nr:preprotein translocase subunit YajC [Teredinibacter waterburyi]